MAIAQRKASRELSGPELRGAFVAAARLLERNRDHINALNVFPVPDGDTGTNMLLTMHSVNEEAARAADTSLSAVAAAVARGALLGARGNSGVILSQFLQGLAKGLEGLRLADGHELASALDVAQKAACKAVGKPVEGTMLTVIRELASAAQARADSNGVSFLAVWAVALEAAKEAVARTPLQLPVLREAGVVDAGGEGVAVLMDGAYRFFTGDGVEDVAVPQAVTPRPLAAVSQDYLRATESEEYGYCTQLLVEGKEMDVDRIRQKLASMADSTVVVGNDTLVKIHVHAFDPGPVVSYAVSLGSLSQVKIENIDRQHQDFMSQHQRPESTARLGVVAVAWGEGFARVFRSAGAAGVIASGQTMNPSTQEILDCVQGLGIEQAIVLPNNPNVIPVAQQSVALSSKPVHVVPSRTLPEGIAALLAFNPEGELEENLKAMRQAVEKVRTAAITTAVRPSRVGYSKIREGDCVCLTDDKLLCLADTPLECLQKALKKLKPAQGGVVTVYWGGDSSEASADEVAAWVRSHYQGVEVEVVHGGQPLYHFIVSVE
jgi:DAK2 domain fusion protein YloV